MTIEAGIKNVEKLPEAAEVIPTVTEDIKEVEAAIKELQASSGEGAEPESSDTFGAGG